MRSIGIKLRTMNVYKMLKTNVCLFFSLSFFRSIFFFKRPYFLKKWNWRKLANNIETKIITCTHFTQSEIVPQIVRNTTLTNNTTTTREQQNYNNKIITTTTGGPEEKIISSQKSSKVLTLSGGGNQNHHPTTQLVTTGEFWKKISFFLSNHRMSVLCFTIILCLCVCWLG